MKELPGFTSFILRPVRLTRRIRRKETIQVLWDWERKKDFKWQCEKENKVEKHEERRRNITFPDRQFQNCESNNKVAAHQEWQRQWCCSATRGCNVDGDGVRVPWEVANKSAKAFEWEWWEWEVSKLLSFRVFDARQWLKDPTTSIFLKKINVNKVTQTDVEFSLCFFSNIGFW